MTDKVWYEVISKNHTHRMNGVDWNPYEKLSTRFNENQMKDYVEYLKKEGFDFKVRMITDITEQLKGEKE